ncbi:class I SAM-dependent methyltransferase [uncultured Amnibacterium sp.]|uniref:class I SAM-dependent methyltransferase n=1 Tax=uncultured Amnibacterium sp. TaxID=1631851 RepID=UPI0035C954C0
MSAVVPAVRFGAGGTDPWAAALRGASAALELVPSEPGGAAEPLDLHRWTATADAADRTTLDGLAGPLLDIGCGPGRMIRAALDAGLQATGLDAEPAAAASCRAQGLPVLRRSVFDPLPREGAWGSLLLLDGNVGIGGDVPAMLARCGALLRPGGRLVVEAHPDPTRDAAALWRLRGEGGGESDPFPWSQVGLPALLRAAHDLALERVWERDGRWFVRLRSL